MRQHGHMPLIEGFPPTSFAVRELFEDDSLLLEIGDNLLLESGDLILLES